jgi:Icc-related predicted phosphoesterase
MRIVDITDLHGRTGRLARYGDIVEHADLLVLSGDITHFGRREDAERVIAPFRVLNPSILAVSGNCDYPAVDDYLRETSMSLHARSEERGSVVFAGVGGSLPCPGRTPNEHTEEDFALFLREAVVSVDGTASRPLVLVSHQPPRETLNDRTYGGQHVGSLSVRRFIEEAGPAVCFCGHIHEGVGIDRIGGTVTVNPGPFDAGGLAVAEIGSDGLEALLLYRDGHIVDEVRSNRR